MTRPHATELTVFFRKRPGTEHVRGGIAFSAFDIAWPDGRPVETGLGRFCKLGARLLLGRRYQGGSALVRLTLQPVAGLDAALTCPRGVRCSRLYALRHGDTIRLHLHDGTPTEAVFDANQEEPPVLRWLQADRMSPGEPFCFDLASQTIAEQCAA